MTNIKDAPEAYSFPEIAAPTTPPTGKVYIYAKADGNMYQKNDADVETALAGGGGGIGGSTGATDNAIIRADGTGGATVQAGSGVTLGDTGIVSGMQFATNLNRFQLGSETDILISVTGVTSTSGINLARNLRLGANTGTTDDFLGFDAAFNTSELLILQAQAGDTITLKYLDAGATNKLRMTSGADYILTEDNPIMFIQTAGNVLREFAWSGSGGGATTALDNLASVAINTSLVSDTDNTDDLGSSSKKWANTFTNQLVLEARSAPSNPASGDVALYANNDGKLVSLTTTGVSRILGIMTEIVPATQLGSSQTTITFSSIPDDFQDLMIVLRARSTAAGTQVLTTFNADTGANYSINYITQGNTGTVTGAGNNNGNNIASLNSCVASTGTTGYFGELRLYIKSYAEVSMTRTGEMYGVAFTNATSIAGLSGRWAWENVSGAISSIELNLNAGDFATDTIYALYGIGTAV